jgi:hypothetical protein
MGRAGEPDTSKALAMLSAFASVGVRLFDMTITDIEGEKVEKKFRAKRSVDELRRTIGSTLQEATRDRHNVIIRPRSTTATVIQLDDLDTEKAERIAPHAFMVIRTSPGNHQAWVAVNNAPQDFARRLRKGAGADPTASGSTRISGSLNFKTKYAPGFPLVEITHTNAGHIVTAAELEVKGFVAASELPRRPPAPVSPETSQSKRKWPNYQLCVRGAPPIHQGIRPDISKADFTFCMTAIDWGWSVEETAQRLMQESTKAQKNGEKYALTTSRNAAAAVERRGQSAKSVPHP